MTATDGFILRNTPILGRTAVTHYLFEIHLNVFIPPASFSVQALSERSQVLLEPPSAGSTRRWGSQSPYRSAPRMAGGPSHPDLRNCFQRGQGLELIAVGHTLRPARTLAAPLQHNASTRTPRGSNIRHKLLSRSLHKQRVGDTRDATSTKGQFLKITTCSKLHHLCRSKGLSACQNH